MPNNGNNNGNSNVQQAQNDLGNFLFSNAFANLGSHPMFHGPNMRNVSPAVPAGANLFGTMTMIGMNHIQNPNAGNGMSTHEKVDTGLAVGSVITSLTQSWAKNAKAEVLLNEMKAVTKGQKGVAMASALYGFSQTETGQKIAQSVQPHLEKMGEQMESDIKSGKFAQDPYQ